MRGYVEGKDYIVAPGKAAVAQAPPSTWFKNRDQQIHIAGYETFDTRRGSDFPVFRVASVVLPFQLKRQGSG